MPHYRLGLRVIKIAGACKGLTGTIIGLDIVPKNTTRHPLLVTDGWIGADCDIQIQSDTDWPSISGQMLPPSIAIFDRRRNWYPILPDSYDAATWDETLWSPKRSKELEPT